MTQEAIWIEDGDAQPPESSRVYVLSMHCDECGNLLLMTKFYGEPIPDETSAIRGMVQRHDHEHEMGSVKYR